ncbi:MAG TPA: phytanoyl-CoA dioxygenase family protein [Planctomycetota bacterium]|nr:phytanoyl-CoA dioxygenase family protein [Planctomycetota bacterium]
MRAIDDDAWSRYERDGYLHLGRTLDDAALAGLCERIDDYMQGRRCADALTMQLDLGGDYAAMGPMTLGHKGATDKYRKIENLELDDRFRAFMTRPLFSGICAKVYGEGAAIGVYRAMFMNKPARQGTVLPWHQDGGTSWGLDRDPLMTVWTALDPATIANGCVEIIPGSHRLGLLHEQGHTVTEEHIAAHCRPGRSVMLELAAGETVLLHNWLLHRSGINDTDIPRRAFSVCYMDARTVQRPTGRTYATVLTARAGLAERLAV